MQRETEPVRVACIGQELLGFFPIVGLGPKVFLEDAGDSAPGIARRFGAGYFTTTLMAMVASSVRGA